MENLSSSNTPSTAADLGNTPNHVVDVGARPRKTRRRVETELEQTYETSFTGVNGYVYTVKYADGKVFLGGSTGESDPWGLGLSHGMAIRDWEEFRASICPDLNEQGFSNTVYVAQWSRPSSPTLYRIEADRFNRARSDFIFITLCDDVEGMVRSRGCGDWQLHPYPLTLDECQGWFKNLFFIQWGDWHLMQRVFREVDNTIKRDRISQAYKSVRIRLVFDGTSSDVEDGLMCRPKIVRCGRF